LQTARADARAFVLRPGVEALEDQKYSVEVLRINTNPVVAHANFPCTFLALRADMYLGLSGPWNFTALAIMSAKVGSSAADPP